MDTDEAVRARPVAVACAEEESGVANGTHRADRPMRVVAPLERCRRTGAHRLHNQSHVGEPKRGIDLPHGLERQQRRRGGGGPVRLAAVDLIEGADGARKHLRVDKVLIALECVRLTAARETRDGRSRSSGPGRGQGPTTLGPSQPTTRALPEVLAAISSRRASSASMRANGTKWVATPAVRTSRPRSRVPVSPRKNPRWAGSRGRK
mmetsp:Transcript_16480/g.52629  ORF Transcript_16480/g.52629 Transcript_16480/m.52629 type:complete len:207 (+) Transcript_16480:399-1019(+)